MVQTLIQLYRNLLTYKGHEVYVAFADKTLEPFFHANQMCELLGYVDHKEAIRVHVEKADIYYLQDIVKDYKSLYKNVQGQTKFLNEGGMLTLVVISRHKKAKEITHWITHEVVPAIIKYGEYVATHESKREITDLKRIIDDKMQHINILEHNMKKQKFKKDKIVYISQTIEDLTNFDFNTQAILVLRFGRTKNMNVRKPPHDTSTKNKSRVIKQIPVKDIKLIEGCVFAKMDDFRLRDNSSFFECTYNQLIDTVAECVRFYENREIDKVPDVHKQIDRGANDNKFNTDDKYLIKIESDNSYNDIQTGGTELLPDEQKSLELKTEVNYLSNKLKYLEIKHAISHLHSVNLNNNLIYNHGT